ncbi:MAG: hydroxyethylthiazole kinase [Syntrophomonadaceae bacterium]|nr:hydroxyethylthiazole kinase [Syntrophomonadaceae bacterium]
MLKVCSEIWDKVRTEQPLVHCISNYVTLNDVANVIIASGASPAMVEHPAESGGFACLAKSVYFNLGTLTGEQEEAMLEAVKGAATAQVPVILDPVACGVIPRKVEVIEKLKGQGKLTVLKGNWAEIKSLAGIETGARGVDSLDDGRGIETACINLAQKENLVVAATGEIDVVSDGDRIAKIQNGTSLFEKITGAGCMVGGVVAACTGAFPQDPWLASITALCAFNIAGERAGSLSGDNPAYFRTVLIDQLYHLGDKDIMKEGKVEW